MRIIALALLGISTLATSTTARVPGTTARAPRTFYDQLSCTPSYRRIAITNTGQTTVPAGAFVLAAEVTGAELPPLIGSLKLSEPLAPGATVLLGSGYRRGPDSCKASANWPASTPPAPVPAIR